jgi:hypothetical protein
VLINVHSMLRFSGDLTLSGVPDRPGSSGSWPLLPVVSLVGDGYLEFQVGDSAVAIAASFMFGCCDCCSSRLLPLSHIPVCGLHSLACGEGMCSVCSCGCGCMTGQASLAAGHCCQ